MINRRALLGLGTALALPSMAEAAGFRFHKFSGKSGVGGAPAVTKDWPWDWAGINSLGYGSSTMAGHSGEPSPMRGAMNTSVLDSTHYRWTDGAGGSAATGGPPMFLNRGAASGGAPSVTMARMTNDQANGALPATTGLLINQYAADWAAGSDATSDNATKAVEYAPTVLAISGDTSMLRSAFWANKPDRDSGPIGSDTYFTNEKFARRMHAAGYRLLDPYPFCRAYDTGTPSDTTNQQKWLMPPSLMADASHTTPAGSELLGKYNLAPWMATKFNAEWPLIHDRRYWSQESTNQTSGGKVCDLAYEGTISGTSATVDNADFAVTFDGPGGGPVLRRATSTFLGALYYRLAITYWRDSIDPADGVLKRFRRVAYVVVWLQRLKGLDAGAYKAGVGAQVVRGEWRSPDGVLTASAFTIAICIDLPTGFTAALDALVGGFRIFNSPAVTIRINQGSNGGHVQCGVGTVALPGLSFNSPSQLTRVDGRRLWLFFHGDLTGGTNNGYGGAYHYNGGSITAWTGNAFGSVGNSPPASPYNPFAMFTDDGQMTQLFGNDASAGGTIEVDRVCVWIARGKIDPVTHANKFRDPTTLKSVLDTVRGSDQPGQVNGIDPIFWQEGSAANLTLNMAAPSEHWVAADWASKTAPSTAAA